MKESDELRSRLIDDLEDAPSRNVLLAAAEIAKFVRPEPTSFATIDLAVEMAVGRALDRFADRQNEPLTTTEIRRGRAAMWILGIDSTSSNDTAAVAFYRAAVSDLLLELCTALVAFEYDASPGGRS